MPDKTEKPQARRETAVAQRRDKILEAAVTCFLENGYHQTGVRDIAKAAGVSLGNLYNHFPGKHDVLVEIASLERTELEPFLKLLTGTDPAPKVLDAFVTAYATYLAKPETVILAIEITSEAIRKPDIGALFLNNRKALVAALAMVLGRGIADGEFRKDLNADEVSQLIVELIEGSAYRSVLRRLTTREILGGLNDFIMSAVRA